MEASPFPPAVESLFETIAKQSPHASPNTSHEKDEVCHAVQGILAPQAPASDSWFLIGQPIVNTQGEEVKQEVLFRLKDSTTLSLPDFFHTTQILNLCGALDAMVVKRMLQAPRDKDFSINLAAESFVSPTIHTLLRQFHNPSRITLEIIEWPAYEVTPVFIQALETLKKIGFRIAIDDCPMMSNTITRVRQLLPWLDIVKVDGRPFHAMLLGETTQAHVRQIFAEFCATLKQVTPNVKTVYEFVPDVDTFTLVKDLGFDYFQGFHFGRGDVIAI